MRVLVPYVVALLTLAIADFVWLGVLAKGFVQRELGSLLLPRPNWTAAALFYVLYPIALLVFAVPQAQHGGIGRAVAFGALFGFFAYATYDLTNLATLKGWSTAFVAVDVAWGTVLSGTASGLAAWALSRA
jgi:uncharacterized membrane protein